MTTQIAINIALWALMLVMIVIAKWDYGVIAIGISVLLVLTGCIDANTALSKFADSNAVIMATMMVVANAFGRTRAVGSIASLLFKVGGSFNNSLRLFMIINFGLGFLLAGAIGRIAIVYPLIIAICERSGKSPAKAMFPVGIMLLCDQLSPPIGNGAVLYNRYNGFLESAGYTFGDKFELLDPFFARLPVSIIMLIYFMTLGIKLAPDAPSVQIESLDLGKQAQRATKATLNKRQEIFAYIIFAFTCIGLILAESLGIAQWMVTVTGAILMYFTGVLTFKEGINAMPFSLIFLYVGALIMGAALLNTGTGHWLGSLVADALGERPSSIALIGAFWLVTMFLTQFMNNGATANLLIPIGIVTCSTIGCSAKGVVIGIQNASLTAWLLPSATAVIPIIMEGGGYDVKTMIKQGILPMVIKTVAGVLWTAFLFPIWP